MAAEVTVRCGNEEVGTGTIRAKIDAVHISCTEVPTNNDDGTQHRYRYRLSCDGVDESVMGSGYSELFTTNADGEHAWEGYVFPATGTWTVDVWDEEEDAAASGVTPAEVTVV